MKILIIGKNGQVGRCIQEKAVQQRVNFVASGREDFDIKNQKQVESYFNQSHDFDFVINAAAYTSVDKAEDEVKLAYAVNDLAVQYLAQTCKLYDIPLIHISTDYVFDGSKETLYAEDDAPKPLSIYGKSKLAGEKSLQTIWHKHIILRVSWVFSEYGKNFVKTIIRLANEKKSLAVVADQYGSPTAANSIADLILIICRAQFEQVHPDSRWGLYHYTDFPLTTRNQFATAIVKEHNLDLKVEPITSADFHTSAKRPKFSGLRVNKIIDAFGFRQKYWFDNLMSIDKYD